MNTPLCAGILLFSLAGFATAECLSSMPDSPSIPKAKTATLHDMFAAQSEVKAYIAAGQAYLQCAQKKNALRPDRVRRKMEIVAAKYNKQRRVFNQRLKNETELAAQNEQLLAQH